MLRALQRLVGQHFEHELACLVGSPSLLLWLCYKDWEGRGGTSLVVQWLRLRAPNAGDLGSIPGQGTRSHVPQLRVHMLQLKIPHAAAKILRATAKTRCSQNKLKKIKDWGEGRHGGMQKHDGGPRDPRHCGWGGVYTCSVGGGGGVCVRVMSWGPRDASREQGLPHLAGPPVCPAVCCPPARVPSLAMAQGQELLELLGSGRVACSEVELAGQPHTMGSR